MLPRWLSDRARFRRPLSRLVARCLGFTGYFQLYTVPFSLLPLLDYTERRDIYQPGGINRGVPTILDELRHREVPFHLSDWRQDESTILAAAEQAIEHGAVRFAYVLLGRLDADLHAYGTGSAICEATAREFVRLSHEGTPYTPPDDGAQQNQPPIDEFRETGFGLYIMQNSVDTVTYETDPIRGTA